MQRSAYATLLMVGVFANLSNRKDENGKGHQARRRRKPSGFRPNSSEFFEAILVKILRVEERKGSSSAGSSHRDAIFRRTLMRSSFVSMTF